MKSSDPNQKQLQQQQESPTSDDDALGALLSPSAPLLPAADEEEGQDEDVSAPKDPPPAMIPSSGQLEDQRHQSLLAERNALRGALTSANERLMSKDEEMATRMDELNRSYSNSLAEMKSLLRSQKKVGTQWKGEMEVLTQRFELKVESRYLLAHAGIPITFDFNR